MPIAEFAYNNTKNASSGYTQFELNYDYYPRVLFKENIDSHLRFCSTDKLAKKLRKLILPKPIPYTKTLKKSLQ